MKVKFRIWDKIEKKMYYPQDFDEKWVIQLGGTVGKFNGKTYNTYTDECVVMLYVGGRDKNGREIYEGDIVREFNQNYNGKDFVLHDTETKYYYMLVKWEEGGFIAEGRGYETINLRYTDFDEVEVVGNIYENPELLEGEEG